MPITEKLSLEDLVDFSLSAKSKGSSSTQLDVTGFNHQAIEQNAAVCPPALTKDDIDIAHERGYNRGKEEAFNEIEKLNKEKEQAVLERIHNALQNSFKPIEVENKRNIETHLNLCVEYLKNYSSHMNAKLLPENIETLLAPLNEIGKIQANVFRWLNIIVHPDDIKFCEKTFSDKEKFQFKVPLKFIADENLNPGDCFIEWQDGALHQRFQNAASHLDKMVEQLNSGIEDNK